MESLTGSDRTLRILTYNVHGCRGTDGRLAPGRIIDVIREARPDVIALQELDAGRARSGHLDQAQAIAEALGMAFHFHPALQHVEEQYGDAILSRLPLRLVKAGPLPAPHNRPLLEPRGAVWAAIRFGDVELQVINTHLGLLPQERVMQAEALLGLGWLQHPECRGRPAVLLGDFNAWPRSRAYELMASHLRDAQRSLPGHRPRATFPSRWPMLRIDHVFISGDVVVRAVEVPRGRGERLASDHLPLVVDLVIGGPAT
ncbi:endonuclease/exonuclease/phosphatase family protein [Plastoroseomonas hellenica]|uniref:endonuclease/exonuclease/phosphatase family protein n=1 Tax=Plastoroseomonas hellenica TaxID=2687306 RepID=UPI001BA70789|nr:endonuclease/exonuclease/phosphatase family protein [Plastoroseomonas hellenica]MBR0645310.1 EEP domain-containing protein [Plastoroseomonas hellenica]